VSPREYISSMQGVYLAFRWPRSVLRASRRLPILRMVAPGFISRDAHLPDFSSSSIQITDDIVTRTYLYQYNSTFPPWQVRFISAAPMLERGETSLHGANQAYAGAPAELSTELTATRKAAMIQMIYRLYRSLVLASLLSSKRCSSMGRAAMVCAVH